LRVRFGKLSEVKVVPAPKNLTSSPLTGTPVEPTEQLQLAAFDQRLDAAPTQVQVKAKLVEQKRRTEAPSAHESKKSCFFTKDVIFKKIVIKI